MLAHYIIFILIGIAGASFVLAWFSRFGLSRLGLSHIRVIRELSRALRKPVNFQLTAENTPGNSSGNTTGNTTGNTPGNKDTGADGLRNYPVRYLSQRHRNSLFNPIPWDATGTLTASDSEFHFLGSSPLGRKIEMKFDSADARINYQRGKLLWDGGHTWCVIEVNGEKHYFSADSGDLSDEIVKNPETGTTQIYRVLTNRYINEN